MRSEEYDRLLAEVDLLCANLPDEERAQRRAVVVAVLSFDGTPYVSEGRSKSGGVDCATLPAESFAEAGVIPPNISLPHYARDWHLHQSDEIYLANIERFTHRVDRKALPADISLWRFGRCVAHSAIVVTWPLCVHAYSESGRVELVTALNPPLPAHRFAGFWSCW